MRFKRLYINGNLRVLGSRNLYGVWNGYMYKLHIYQFRKKEEIRFLLLMIAFRCLTKKQ